MLFGETFQMCPRHNKQSDRCYGEAASLSKKRDNTDCPISFGSSPPQSSMSSLSDNPSTILVYKRRKTIIVYKRRKLHPTSVAIASKGSPESATTSRESSLSVISDAPSVAVKDQAVEIPYSFKVGGSEVLGTPISVCTKEPHDSKLESRNCSSVLEDLDSDGFIEKVGQKTSEVESLNDCCSSSRSTMDLVAASTRSEMDGTCECSSSGVILEKAIIQEQSENDLCLSIIRKHGVFGQVQARKSNTYQDIGDSNCKSSSQSCKACSRTSSTLKMLICDKCDDAFHLSCCYLRIKEVPVDEWLCHPCRMGKPKSLKESVPRKPASIISARGRNRNSLSTMESGPIALMLRDKKPYTTDVRIGKGFQADVPDWSGPVNNDTDAIGEALEMDSSTFFSFPDLKDKMPCIRGFMSNWLQCKEILDVPGSNGAICGKWRRAPLFEVQTDDWECFQAFFWDPAHADCAVPQELETEEVLKQVKHIRQMRPRLAKEPQLVHAKNCTLFGIKDGAISRGSSGSENDHVRSRKDFRNVYVRKRITTK